MASKFTKDTPPNITASAWARWVHVRSTDAASAGAKSKRTLKSLNSERAVVERLARLGWRDILHDVTCLHVQVDILARSPAGTLTLVEVKTSVPRIARGQLLRLRRVLTFLAQFEPVEFRLAVGVQLLPVEELTEFPNVGHWRG